VFANFVGKSPTFDFRYGAQVLLGKKTELQELKEDFNKIQKENGAPEIPDHIYGALVRITSGHLGILNLIISNLSIRWEKIESYSEERTIDFIIGGKLINLVISSRAYLFIDELSSDQKHLLMELVTESGIECTETNRPITDSLVRLGIVIKEDGYIYFLCDLMKRLYLDQLVIGKLEKTFSPPTTLKELVLLCISLLNPETFVTTLVIWHRELHMVLKNLLPNCIINPEMASVVAEKKPYPTDKNKVKVQNKQTKRKSGNSLWTQGKKRKQRRGAIDYYIDSDSKWLLEILREANDVDDHLNRFKPGGAYANFPQSDYLVVDFRRQSKGITDEEKKKDRLWVVSYSDDFKSARVYQCGVQFEETVVMFSNTVPTLQKF